MTLLIIAFLLGFLLCYLLTGLWVMNIARPVNEWLLPRERVGLEALVTWPSAVKRLAEAGTVTGQTLGPHPNKVQGHD